MVDSNSPRRSKFNTIEVVEVHSNVGQEVIEITSDRLTIILSNHVESLISRKDWHTPLSLLVAFAIVLCTTVFKEFGGISADTWSAVFIMSAGLCILWLIRSLFKLKEVVTIEGVVEAAKNKR